jgi:hypothetical protein
LIERNRLLKDEILIRPAVEPSNILWENLHVSKKTRFMKELKVIAIVTVILILMFILFTYLDVISTANLERYPPTTNCTNIDGMF